MPNPLIEYLNDIKDARDDIKLKLIEKQSEEVTDDITTYADLIDNIQSGSGEIKLFRTESEMRADTSEEENKYAVVYSDETRPITTGMKISDIVASEDRIEIPAEVDLSNGYSCNMSLLYKGSTIDFYVSISSYSIDYEIWGGGAGGYQMYYQKDSSNDHLFIRSGVYQPDISGLYYSDGALRFNEPVEVTINENSLPESVFNILCSTEISYFSGMFKWKHETDLEYQDVVTGIEIDDQAKTCTTVNEQQFWPTLYSGDLEFLSNYQDIIGNFGECIIVYDKVEDELWIYRTSSSMYPFINVTNNHFGICNVQDRFKIDIKNQTMSDFEELEDTPQFINGSYTYNGYDIGSFNRYNIISFIYYREGVITKSYIDDYSIYWFKDGQTSNLDGYTKTFYWGDVNFLGWHHVETEFTVNHPYEIMDGLTAYGHHGVVTGHGLYDHLDLASLVQSRIGRSNYLIGPSQSGGKYVTKGSLSDNDLTKFFYEEILIDRNENIPDNRNYTFSEEYFIIYYTQDNVFHMWIYSLQGELVKHETISDLSSPGLYTKGKDIYILSLNSSTKVSKYAKYSLEGQLNWVTFTSTYTYGYGTELINGNLYRTFCSGYQGKSYEVYKNNQLLFNKTFTSYGHLVPFDEDDNYIYFIQFDWYSLLVFRIYNKSDGNMTEIIPINQTRSVSYAHYTDGYVYFETYKKDDSPKMGHYYQANNGTVREVATVKPVSNYSGGSISYSGLKIINKNNKDYYWLTNYNLMASVDDTIDINLSSSYVKGNMIFRCTEVTDETGKYFELLHANLDKLIKATDTPTIYKLLQGNEHNFAGYSQYMVIAEDIQSTLYSQIEEDYNTAEQLSEEILGN